MRTPLGIGVALILAGLAQAQPSPSPIGSPIVFSTISDESQYVGKACTNYNNGYYNIVTGHVVACVNTGSFLTSLRGVWTVLTTGGAGSATWGGISGVLSNQ